MKKEEAQLKQNMRQQSSSLEIEELISSLQKNESPKKQFASPEAQAATRLHALTADDHIDSAFSAQLKQQIMNTVQPDTLEKKQLKRHWNWKWILLPIAPLGVTAAALIVALQFNEHTTETALTTDAVNSTTAEPLIGTPILSEDEDANSAALPAGGYTIDYVEFQRKLNERSTGSLVNVEEINDPAAGSVFANQNETPHYYTDLRNTAYSLLESDKEIMTLLSEGGVDVSNVENLLTDFEKQIESWPTDEEPFNNDAYSQAVNDVVQHNEEWNKLMKEITDELIQDYQKQHPEWDPPHSFTEDNATSREE